MGNDDDDNDDVNYDDDDKDQKEVSRLSRDQPEGLNKSKTSSTKSLKLKSAQG